MIASDALLMPTGDGLWLRPEHACLLRRPVYVSLALMQALPLPLAHGYPPGPHFRLCATPSAFRIIPALPLTLAMLSSLASSATAFAAVFIRGFPAALPLARLLRIEGLCLTLGHAWR